MTQRLFLLRHGEVTSHRGDVPVTEAGLQTAVDAGRRLAARSDGAIRVISGETRRIRGRMPEEEDRRWFSWFRKKKHPEPESVDPMREFLGGDRPGF